MKNFWLDKKAAREKKVQDSDIYSLLDPGVMAGLMSKGNKKQLLKTLPKVMGVAPNPKMTKGGILLP